MWRVTYSLCWFVALGCVGVGLGFAAPAVIGVTAERVEDVQVVAISVLGLAGSVAGFWIAARTWRSADVHVALLWIGTAIVAMGFAAGGAFHSASLEVRGTGFLAGFGEFLLALLCYAIGLIGAVFVMAGIAGRRGRRAQSESQARASSSQSA